MPSPRTKKKQGRPWPCWIIAVCHIVVGLEATPYRAVVPGLVKTPVVPRVMIPPLVVPGTPVMIPMSPTLMVLLVSPVLRPMPLFMLVVMLTPLTPPMPLPVLRLHGRHDEEKCGEHG